MKKSSKAAVLIFGQPGAGKGTQAELLAKRMGFVHFDTGRYFEQIVFDPRLQKDSVIKEQRRLFETGKLWTPSWVLSQITEKVKDFSRAGLSIVFSGSPRTLYEAFGDKKKLGLMKILEKLYGKKNVSLFFLKVSADTSIRRNSHRLICSVCKGILLNIKPTPKICPFCGGKLLKRVLDKPEIIKKRLEEFKKLTEPVFSAMKRRGYKIIEVDGNALPFKINKRINDSIKNR
ncbi:MAG: nucleoside monophosphate kinase [Candidatus Paceibacterota bacterium]|jgi:adenylate kinase